MQNPVIPESSKQAEQSLLAVQPEQQEHHEQAEHSEHIEYSDQQIERAHEVLGISGMPYLILESDAAKFAERNIDVSQYLKQHDTSFFAPGAIPNLFKKNKWNQVFVEIGKNSNVQEIGKMEITQGQEVQIKIGEGTSIAHGVKFLPSDGEMVNYTIGNNVFIGIGTHLAEGVIGNNCNIGFNCRLENDVEVGDYVTICDGAVIEEEIKLPPFTVVPPGLRVTREIAEKPAVSPAEYVEMTKNATEPVKTLIRFTFEQQQEILHAEAPDQLSEKNGVNGNLKANSILDQAGVEASSLFLTQFNRIVVSENRLFPLMYRLIGKFHPEHVENSDRSTEANTYGNNVQIMDLPVDRTAFIKHYMDQVKNGVQEGDIAPYQGEFTTCQVDWDRVRFKGDTHLIGPIEITGNSEFGKHFVGRFDEGNKGDKLKLNKCNLGAHTTFHASGSKTLDSVEAGDECVFHGSIYLVKTALGSSIILHNVSALGSNLHGDSILLGATIKDSTVGTGNVILGHHGQIDLEYINTAKHMVVLHKVKILGRGKERDQLIWFGNGSKIRENTVIYGRGAIKRNQLFGPNGVYEIIPGQEVRKLTPSEMSNFIENLTEQGVIQLQSMISDSTESQLPS